MYVMESMHVIGWSWPSISCKSAGLCDICLLASSCFFYSLSCFLLRKNGQVFHVHYFFLDLSIRKHYSVLIWCSRIWYSRTVVLLNMLVGTVNQFNVSL